MNAKFLKSIQRAGWAIESVTGEAAVARCPAVGCGLRAKLALDTHVPQVDPGYTRNPRDYPVSSFDEIREVLRDRRQRLGLSIKEVEELAGIAVDFVAKFEKDDPSKLPNILTTMEWIQALGYEVVLRPADMSALTLRTISETRKQQPARQNRFKIEGQRRRDRRMAGDT